MAMASAKVFSRIFQRNSTMPISVSYDASEVGQLRVGKGKRGRWRFFLYDADGTLLMLAPVRGYATREEAVAVFNRGLNVGLYALVYMEDAELFEDM